MVHAGSFHLAGPMDNQELTCEAGTQCEIGLQGWASPLWREWWITSSGGQLTPGYSLALRWDCVSLTWVPASSDPEISWRLESAAGRHSFWVVSGASQRCPNRALHLKSDCSFSTVPFGFHLNLSWVFVPALSGDHYWIVSSADQACPSKMLALDPLTLQVLDFFRSEFAIWEVTARHTAPWPYRSSILLVPEAALCDENQTTDSREKPGVVTRDGLENPAACCKREAGLLLAETPLTLGLGTPSGDAGRFSMCWGWTQEGKGVQPPVPAMQHPVRAGGFTLVGPMSFGYMLCTLGMPCELNLVGLGLSLIDSVVIQNDTLLTPTTGTCPWPQAPSVGMTATCTRDGSDAYVQ